MAWSATNHVDILNAVVARLQAQVTGFNSVTCFVSDVPEPPANVAQQIFATVAPTSSQFDQANQIGGGANVLIEDAGITVTIFSKLTLDRVGQAAILLTETTKGLLVKKKQILKALVGWMPVDGSNNQIGVSHMRALGCSPVGQYQDGGRMSIQFSSEFLWDLS